MHCCPSRLCPPGSRRRPRQFARALAPLRTHGRPLGSGRVAAPLAPADVRQGGDPERAPRVGGDNQPRRAGPPSRRRVLRSSSRPRARVLLPSDHRAPAPLVRHPGRHPDRAREARERRERDRRRPPQWIQLRERLQRGRLGQNRHPGEALVIDPDASRGARRWTRRSIMNRPTTTRATPGLLRTPRRIIEGIHVIR